MLEIFLHLGKLLMLNLCAIDPFSAVPFTDATIQVCGPLLTLFYKINMLSETAYIKIYLILLSYILVQRFYDIPQHGAPY